MRKGAMILGIALVCLFAACGAGSGAQTWTEPFNDPGDWQLSSDAAADVTIAEGQLVITVRQPGQVAWASAGRIYQDFALRVEATQIAGPLNNEYGILIRMQGDEDFYVFSISGDGYARVARYTEGRWTLLSNDWFLHEAIVHGAATNILDIAADGADFTFRVNEQTVATVTDAALTQGDLGVYAGAFEEPGVVIAFDNLHVEPLP